jgi:hypothetical protein
MADAGVSRVSFGVQTLAPKVQEAVGRIQPKDLLVDGIERLRAVGIHAINMDLMYGLPFQTVEDVVEAAHFAAEMGAARVSFFGYAHVPWFAKHQSAIDESALPGLDERFRQAEAGAATLTGAGFHAIGLDHFAAPDDPLTRAARAGTLRRNFQGYTDDPCETLVGIGSTSISQFRQGYVQNFKARTAWTAAVENGRLPSERGIELTEDDRLRARAIEKLMCQLWVDVDATCREMGADPARWTTRWKLRASCSPPVSAGSTAMSSVYRRRPASFCARSPNVLTAGTNRSRRATPRRYSADKIRRCRCPTPAFMQGRVLAGHWEAAAHEPRYPPGPADAFSQIVRVSALQACRMMGDVIVHEGGNEVIVVAIAFAHPVIECLPVGHAGIYKDLRLQFLFEERVRRAGIDQDARTALAFLHQFG